MAAPGGRERAGVGAVLEKRDLARHSRVALPRSGPSYGVWRTTFSTTTSYVCMYGLTDPHLHMQRMLLSLAFRFVIYVSRVSRFVRSQGASGSSLACNRSAQESSKQDGALS